MYISGSYDHVQLKFESIGSNDYRVKLLKLKVEQDNIFYESFDRMTNTMGNNGFNGNALSGYCSAENLDSKDGYVQAVSADKCIYIANGSDRFTSSSLNLSNKAVLSFKAAGDINNTPTINISYAKSIGKTPDYTFTTAKGEWNTYRMVITTSTPAITISGNHFFLDEVKVYTPFTTELNDNIDNTEPILHLNNKIVNATINRSFPAGQWNTLCLPFDVSQSAITEAFDKYNGASVRILNRVENGTFYFNKVKMENNQEIIPAGTPFLIKLEKTMSNPTFKLVTISATEPVNKINGEGYGFAGTFSPISLKTDGSNAFLSAPDAQGNQYIYTPAAGKNNMNGLRAYFVMPAKSNGVRIHIADSDELSGISQHAAAVTTRANGVYNLNGQRIDSDGTGLPSGIYIINGKKTIIQ